MSSQQITGETIGEVRAVSDMHQRKAEMARQADAFIALPGMQISFMLLNRLKLGTWNKSKVNTYSLSGGYGTLEELLEVITWAQLGIHHKPVSYFFIYFLIALSGHNNSGSMLYWRLAFDSYATKNMFVGFLVNSPYHIGMEGEAFRCMWNL